MKTYAVMFCAMLAMGALTVSCSSEDEATAQGASGQASIMIDLSSDLSYSRAIDESEYMNTQNYKVTLSSEKGDVFKDALYSSLDMEYKVDFNTPYTLTAYYGEDVAYGYDKLYVKGSTTFSIPQGDRKTITVNCTPANAKLILKYAGLSDNDTFEEYFQDCLIKIKECTLKEQIDLINQKIESMPSAMEKLKLASKKNELIVQKNALRRKDG